MAPLLLKFPTQKITTTVSTIEQKNDNDHATKITKNKGWFILSTDGIAIFRSKKHSDVLDALLETHTTSKRR